jgi:hypothetical protein
MPTKHKIKTLHGAMHMKGAADPSNFKKGEKAPAISKLVNKGAAKPTQFMKVSGK